MHCSWTVFCISLFPYFVSVFHFLVLCICISQQCKDSGSMCIARRLAQISSPGCLAVVGMPSTAQTPQFYPSLQSFIFPYKPCDILKYT